MKQQTGYLIARTKAKNEFFTSASSYDRPQWKSIKESTTYPTVELAQNALTKLLKNGLSYEARLVSVQEALDIEFPNGETGGRGKFAETPGGNEYPKGDQVSHPGSPEGGDEMTSDDEGGVCPECNHEPCTCVASDEEGHCPACGAELDSGHDEGNGDITGDETSGDAEVIPGEIDKFEEKPGEEEENAFSHSRFSRGQSVTYRGAKYQVVSDAGTGVAVIAPKNDASHPIQVSNVHLVAELFGLDPTSLAGMAANAAVGLALYHGAAHAIKARVAKAKAKSTVTAKKPIKEGEFVMPAKPPLDGKPTDNKTTAATYDGKYKTIKYNDPAMTDAKFDQGGDPQDEKVKVPADVLADLKAAIAEFSKNAEFSNTRDDAKASFLMTASEAMKSLLAYLELGTVDGITKAQIHLTSLMSPITNHVPISVQKFVYKGGKKSTLKDLFDDKRAEKKGASTGAK